MAQSRLTEDTPLLVDPRLPGAGLLLARGPLEEWLSQRLGRSARVRLRRLRYKAGTSLVLGFDLETDAGGPPRACVAWAYADGSQAKLGKTLERLPPSTFLGYDARLAVLATTAGGDRFLPALTRLERPGGVARMVRKALPGLDAPEGASVRTLRHNPGRRWVGCLESDDGGGAPVRAVFRAYPDQLRMSRAWNSYAMLSRRGAPTPRPLGRSRTAAMIAVAWAEGEPLARMDDPDRWRDVGAGLARLHSVSQRRLERIGVESEIDAVSRTAATIASLLPDLASATTTLAERVADLLRTVPRDLVTIHGDFSPDQVVVDAQGAPTLIDLDAAGVGASAADLGCFLASTPSGGGDLLTEATLEGYSLVRRPPDAGAVAGYALAYGLRKAIDPFRECAPDWPAALTRRVQSLEARSDRLERGEVGS